MDVYVANLEKRTDRLKSIEREFAHKPEFRLNIVRAVQHPVPAFGLWRTFMKTVRMAKDAGLPYYVFCEDDHKFTKSYSADFLTQCIDEAQAYQADILPGGVSSMKDPVQCSDRMFWLGWFNGTQFIIVFRRFYDRLIAADQAEGYGLDIKISEMSDKIFVTTPYISIQKEFGYSDVNSINGRKGRLKWLFGGTERSLQILSKVKRFYADR